MKQTTAIMAAIAVFLSALALRRGGSLLLLEGLLLGAKNLVGIIPLLVAAFTISGLMHVLLPEELIKKLLGKDAGIKGVFIGAIAGGLIPGGPYVFLPIAATFFAGGAEIGSILAFITAKNLWSLTRLPLEVALLGTHITIVRFTVTFIFPIVVGILGNLIYSRYCEGIRTKVKENIL